MKSLYPLVSFLFIILIIPTISSQTIEINYPSSVSANEEFSVSVKLIDFQADIYDIKIDILASGSGERVSRILNNGEWKSTFYYINDIINAGEEKSFSLKIESYTGNADMTVKIRDSSGVSVSFNGYSLEVDGSGAGSSNNETNENPNQEMYINTTNNSNSNVNEENIVNSENNNSNIQAVNENLNDQTKKESSIIMLNSPKDIKSEKDSVKNSDNNAETEENKIKYALYGLFGFCILLGVLWFLKMHLENRKNEFK
ncbi:MAG TPA: hypothetical protein VJH65_01355 [Candidatus Nanoarchaeia archaeon]|nr:hypothetical protein [Candidatus Nanoarchaeia archaeon]